MSAEPLRELPSVLCAVHAAFPWIDDDKLLRPVMGGIDGSFVARMVVFHVLIETFGVPKKRIEAALGIDLGTVRRAVKRVDALRISQRFDVWLQVIAAEAVAHFNETERGNG